VGDQSRRHSAFGRVLAGLLFAAPVFIGAAPEHALALSELKPAEAPSPETPGTDPLDANDLPPLEGPLSGPDGGLPLPDPVIRTPLPAKDQASDANEQNKQAVSIELMRDLSLLPEPVQRMRTLIIEAATSGDPERLRALLGKGTTATRLSFGEIDGDPVTYIRAISGDGEGLEILAIMIDLLDAGFVRLDADGPEEAFVWPYFAAVPLESLAPPQRVELLRIVTAGDIEDMKAYGAYNFFRIGITPDGAWSFFMAGD
jgi:hypothetical protein